jgi:hypothetical protein
LLYIYSISSQVLSLSLHLNARHSSECPNAYSYAQMRTHMHARHSSQYLTTGNREFPRRAITSHYRAFSGTFSTRGKTCHH